MGILGIDFGLRKIGIAISNGDLAEPLSVISNSKNVMDQLESICQKYNVSKIVIGLPGRGKMVELIKRFGIELKTKLAKPVIFWDETLTTVEAKHIGKGKREDQIAAALILQSYLDYEKNKNHG